LIVNDQSHIGQQTFSEAERLGEVVQIDFLFQALMLCAFSRPQTNTIEHFVGDHIGHKYAAGKSIKDRRLGVLIVIHGNDWDPEPSCRQDHRTRPMTDGDRRFNPTLSNELDKLARTGKKAEELINFVAAVMFADDSVCSGKTVQIEKLNGLCVIARGQDNVNIPRAKMFDDRCKKRNVRRIVEVDPDRWFARGHVARQAFAPAEPTSADETTVQTCSIISSVNSAYIGSESNLLICS
jgi:hypothetical protein